ncbi:PSP1 domain-containing protein [Phorcysia thermohydrogeniphila]|uniref:Cell fate regulator YaaT (PSP1 superfamily) n=1 Tax=Phorcysia thermohydrogeniphila TaxID=936138 RepID=A0A4R1G777_9BACT|nr:regulatory iron-sulfur-containing complex subunit RicT [Phorcysia thermohydrogeniphila]TCK03368.1 cell fate regulator YaaT (PSP1 superfamily) [Phorcysia thermohydrogeniphila]
MLIVKFKYPDTEKTGLATSSERFTYGQRVVVKTDRGEEVVKVLNSYPFDEEALRKFNIDKNSLYKVIRLATEEDINRATENELFAVDALEVCKEKVEKHQLPMKLIRAYATLNKERIVFYFTAESRVDFRQLVRDLAAHFRTRIELRQIGVRDEVKMLGAVGMCGRVCCCKDFLECFDSVSLNLARLQGLPPNPAKLSGACGRLMCCLKFEEANYYVRQFLPEIGETVETPEGKGKVADINVPLEIMTVELEDGRKKHFPIRLFLTEEQWNEYIEKLKEKQDDRFKCFTRAGVIGNENSQGAEESSE